MAFCTPRRTAIYTAIASTVLVFIASVLSWFGVAESVNNVPTDLICATAGYSDSDCDSPLQSLVPLCCLGVRDNSTAFAVPSNWWDTLQGCGDQARALIAYLPSNQVDSSDLLTRDKWIQCEGDKAASSWLKYIASVIGWVSVFLQLGGLARPNQVVFDYSKYLSVITIAIALVGLQQVLADANTLQLFSFEKCQEYTIPNVNGVLALPAGVTDNILYCSDTTMTGAVATNQLYWHLVLTMNCYVVGTVLLIVACLVILARPYLSREALYKLRSTGPKGVYY